MLQAFVWRYQLSFFHTCQARFATGEQIWPNKFLTFKFQLFLGKRFQKAPVLLVDVRWRNKRLRGNWRWRRKGTLERSLLNIFHKAKAKTLANESQQTWTNQFRSWLSKNTAYGPIINFPSLREFVAAFLLQLFKRSLYLHHRVPEGGCVGAQLESMIRFLS